MARTGRFRIPRFLSRSIFSLHASWITDWIDLIPPPFLEFTFTTEYPCFLKYSIHSSFLLSSARSALFKRISLALFFPSSSMSGLRLLSGTLASTNSIIRSISLIFSCIIPLKMHCIPPVIFSFYFIFLQIRNVPRSLH